MGTVTAKREARISARATESDKQLLEQAALLLGISVSDYLISSGLEKARIIIRDQHQLILNQEDSVAFATALLNPPLPSNALKEAKERYAKSIIPEEGAER